MKKIFLATVTIGLFAMASAASAGDEKMYLGTMGDKQMVMGGSSAEGTELMMGTNGARPENCPTGSYYTTDSSQQMVMACDGDTRFSLAAPEAGMMMSDGKPYPEGAMLMTPAQ